MKFINIKRKNSKGEEEEYKLAFTRNVVRNMDRKFDLMSVVKTPLDGIPALFAGAFRAFHPTIDKELLDVIWEEIPNKEEFLKTLMEMYKEPIESLMDEPKEKNATWEVVG